MLGQEKLDRINALAKKKREIGLTDEETIEQNELRVAYIAAFRSSFRQQLDCIEIVDPQD